MRRIELRKLVKGMDRVKDRLMDIVDSNTWSGESEVSPDAFLSWLTADLSFLQALW